MEAPRLLPMATTTGAIHDITYRAEGELVPVLHLALGGSTSVFFEHHIVLWKTPELAIALRPMKGALKRMVAGMQVFVTETEGSGQIAFSRDGAGHIFALELAPGTAVVVREHQFLAATSGVEYSFIRVKGAGNVLFGGAGFFIDRFHSPAGPGVLWLHGYGNVFEMTLAAGEVIDVEPGGWIYADESAQMETIALPLKSGVFGSGNGLFFNRFHGPGRVAIQSMYVHMPTSQ
jgi:uncharacterized protein (AIM24 family)